MPDELLNITEASTVTTGEPKLLETGEQINLTVNRIAELVEVQSANQLEIQSTTGTLTVYAPGPVGARGPQGPQGIPGGPISNFAELQDVLLVNLADANLIKYSAGLQKFTNTGQVDGGSF